MLLNNHYNYSEKRALIFLKKSAIPQSLLLVGGFLFTSDNMARQDINMDVVYGELETSDNLTNKIIYDFKILEEQVGMDNDNYCYS